MDRAALKTLLDDGLSLAEIGRKLGRHESTVAHWLQIHGLEANGRDKHAGRGGLSRDVLAPLASAEMSIAQIADAVDRSKATVRYWLGRYELRTVGVARKQRSAQVKAALEAGLAETRLECPRHGETDFVLDTRGYYRCRRCRSAAVSKRRRKVKSILVREAGGACCLCGYSCCLAALEFHHLLPAEKSFALSEEGVARSLARARTEAEKCVLLCANCHAEVEVGMATIAGRE